MNSDVVEKSPARDDQRDLPRPASRSHGAAVAGRPSAAVRVCPRCQSKRVHRSHRRAGLDRLLFALGAEIRRCHDCRFRHAEFFSLNIPLAEPQNARRRWASLLVMTSGFLVCLLIMWFVIRRFTDLSG
jgi:predicted RNA-binding Zn-ribbon protein involved in translation (DUF1610 family)